MLSTITSPVFSDVIVVYENNNFYNVGYSNPGNGQAGKCNESTWYHQQFEVFREMYKVRDFRLVLSAYCVNDNSARELERAVEVEKAKGGLPPELSAPYTLAAR